MGTPTTIGAIPTGCGCCAAECDDAGADRRIGGQDSATPFTFAALYRAWQACRRGKRGTRKAQRYETRLLDNLVDTAQALQEHTWRPSRAIRFITIHPKPREILASEIGDRVVHHLLVPWFERLYEPVFIADSFANRCGKGSHAAVARLQAFSRAVSANGHRPACYLQHGCVKARLRRRQLRALYVPAEPSASSPAIDNQIPGVQS